MKVCNEQLGGYHNDSCLHLWLTSHLEGGREGGRKRGSKRGRREVAISSNQCVMESWDGSSCLDLWLATVKALGRALGFFCKRVSG